MSASTIRNAKLVGDVLHVMCYPTLFAAIRSPKMIKQGISFNSQFLFFLALAFRYSSVVLETEDMTKATTFFGKKTPEQMMSFDLYVDIYKKSGLNHIYVFALKAIPLVCSFAAVMKLVFSHHREKRDNFHWFWVLAMSVSLASAFHSSTQAKSAKSQDPMVIARTASYFIEVFAIVPQLWMQYGRQPIREEVVAESFALDLHFVSRFGFRAVYVGCWLYKLVQEKSGLKGPYADNLPHLAGLLQVGIYVLLGDILFRFMRNYFRVVFMFGASIGLVLVNFGQAMFVKYMIIMMLACVALIVPTGGLSVCNCLLVFGIMQLYRAGAVTFRNPLEFVQQKPEL